MEREQGGDRDGGRFFQRRRPCRFCIDKGSIDFKDVGLLRNFLTERGRIVPRRISGNCMRHQRVLTVAIKRARTIAMVGYAEERGGDRLESATWLDIARGSGYTKDDVYELSGYDGLAEA